MEMKLIFLWIIFSLIKYNLSESYAYNITGYKEIDLGIFKRVYGNNLEDNNYYITLYLGLKQDIQTYALDTCSSVTASMCGDCGEDIGIHVTYPFDFNDTSKILSCNSDDCSLVGGKCEDEQCSFDVHYPSQEDIMSGYFINYPVEFDPPYRVEGVLEEELETFNLPFGCTKKVEGLYKERLNNGVLGLANTDKSFVVLLYKKKLIKHNLFSLCFAQRGGYITFGEIFNLTHKTNKISYIPLKMDNEPKKSSFYSFKIKNIKTNKGTISVEDNYIAYIDSSSDVTLLPGPIYKKLWEEIKGNLDKTLNVSNIYKMEEKYGKSCFTQFPLENTDENNTSILNEFWPNITFHFENGFDFEVKPTNYYLNYSDRVENVYCLGFKEGKELSNDEIVIVGSFMNGYDFIFDREEHKLGIVEADCYEGGLVGEQMMINRYYKKKEKKIREINGRILAMEDDSPISDNLSGEEKNKFQIKTIFLLTAIICLFAFTLSGGTFLLCFKKRDSKNVSDVTNKNLKKEEIQKNE